MSNKGLMKILTLLIESCALKSYRSEERMIELISYCILGGCLLWTLGLMFYLCVESAIDEAELEDICHQHAKREW